MALKRSEIICGACAALAGVALNVRSAARADTTPVHWGYNGSLGPDQWGNLEADFKECGIGTDQSPIDLTNAVPAQIGPIRLAYKDTPLRIVNNGHSIQVNYNPGSTLTVRDRTYEIAQFHFHTPSEHSVDGKHFPLEMHIVHTDADKNVAVLGVFFSEGETNQVLDTLWKAAPPQAGPERAFTDVNINVAKLVTSTDAYYEYLGSLTTPPCSEDIKWLVLAAPNHASTAQVATFQTLYANNARPVRPLAQRLLLKNG